MLICSYVMYITYCSACNTSASDVCEIKITYLLTYLLGSNAQLSNIIQVQLQMPSVGIRVQVRIRILQNCLESETYEGCSC